MKRKHPSQVMLDADEVHRAHRIAVAHYLGMGDPCNVDAMRAGDFQDVLNVMWAENQR